MKKGTIFKNLWAGYETYFVYMGYPVRTGRAEAAKVGGYRLANVDGKWKFERSVMYRRDLKDEEHFPVVGHIDFDKMLIDGILQAIGKPPKEE